MACGPGADPAAAAPERLDAFFARANAAYYASRDPLGEWTTSPEISQCFGEVLGAFAIDLWARAGQPQPFRLIEAGPGRGTLMADMLRIIRRHAPAMAQGLVIDLIETSPLLRAAQAARLVPGGAAQPEMRVQWHDTLESIPPGPCLFIANEFLDALPIRQFERTSDGWQERYVQNGRFVLQPAPALPALRGFAIGDVLELREPAEPFCASLAARLLRDGGAALIIDYGHCVTGPADTLQALLHGQPAPPLEDPGSRDLTAHVDFAALARAGRAARVFGPVTQGAFLTELGLLLRADALARANPDQANAIRTAAARLVAPGAMGEMFKVIGFAHPRINTLAGFPGEPAP